MSWQIASIVWALPVIWSALLVLGEHAGVALAQKRGMDALFVLREGTGFEEISIVAGKIEMLPDSQVRLNDFCASD